MTASDSTERFSSRVADYVRYRPDYPPALLEWLHGPMGVSHRPWSPTSAPAPVFPVACSWPAAIQ